MTTDMDLQWTPWWMPTGGGPAPEPLHWPAVGDGLRTARYLLGGLPTDRIAAAVDTATTRWRDRAYPPRRRVIGAATGRTGIPAHTLDRLLDAELSACLGDVRRQTRRTGPGPGSVVTLCVIPGAVPGPVARSVTRILLGGSAVIVLVPPREPGFAAAFLRTLHDCEPMVADAALVTCLRRTDPATLRAARAQADAVCYG